MPLLALTPNLEVLLRQRWCAASVRPGCGCWSVGGLCGGAKPRGSCGSSCPMRAHPHPPTPTLTRQWAAGASSLKLLAGDAKLKAIPIHCRLCCVGTMSSSSEILLSPNPSDFSPRSSVPPPASSHTVNPAAILGEQRSVFLFLKKSVTKDPCNTWKMAQGWDLGHTLRTAGLVRGSPCALANGLGTASEGLGPVNIDFDVQIFYWIVVHWYKVFIGSWQ